MKLSAVIPTKNRASDLLRAVESVFTQSCLPDELLIIDQSDTDISKTAVEALFAGRSAAPKLIYVYDPSIAGLVAAKAVAVEKSSGDVVMFLEDDIVLEPDYVASLAQGFIDDPRMMGACGVISAVAGTGKFYLAMFHLFHRGIFFDPRVSIHGHTDSTKKLLIQSNYLSGGVSAYRREVFQRIKFDQKNNFFMLEDIDFSTRAAAAYGVDRFFINTSARLAHLMSPANRARLGGRYQRKLREFICFYKKNRYQKSALPNLMWLLIGMSIEAIVVSIKLRHSGPAVGSFKGMIDGFRWKILPE